jgi:hypothetical protein
MIEQSNKPQRKKNNGRINYTKWAFMLGIPAALISALAAVVVVPEIRCGIGWKAESCAARNQPIEIITQDETGTVLSGVRVQVVSQGTPEVQSTDNNGYVQVQIPSRGKVFVILSKEDYPTQNITIDLENEQSTIRRVTLSKSGIAQVQQASDPNISSQQRDQAQQASISGDVPLPTSTNSLSSSAEPNANSFTGNPGIFPSKYIAKWKGTVTFTNSETKSTAQSGLTLSFNSGKTGSRVGEVNYQNGNCQGSLILKSVKSNTLELFENITNGFNSCTKNSTVIVTFMGDDIIEFKRTAAENQNIGSGLLTRQTQ